MQLIGNDGFLQVHRSFIVAQKHIKSNQLFIGKHIVPIGKYFKSQVDALLG
jgi:DNA-binding LytR/AlgR family response regulator